MPPAVIAGSVVFGLAFAIATSLVYSSYVQNKSRKSNAVGGKGNLTNSVSPAIADPRQRRWPDAPSAEELVTVFDEFEIGKANERPLTEIGTPQKDVGAVETTPPTHWRPALSQPTPEITVSETWKSMTVIREGDDVLLTAEQLHKLGLSAEATKELIPSVDGKPMYFRFGFDEVNRKFGEL